MEGKGGKLELEIIIEKRRTTHTRTLIKLNTEITRKKP